MGELANHPCVAPKPPLAVTITNWYQLNMLNTTVTELTVANNSMNDASPTVLDLSRFRRLKKIVIGDECLVSVERVVLIGLRVLESVEVGKNSFTKYQGSFDIVYNPNPNRHFYLKSCPKLKRLRIYSNSFMDYSVCEIENVDALETIDVGWNSFFWASLELKSILIHSE